MNEVALLEMSIALKDTQIRRSHRKLVESGELTVRLKEEIKKLTDAIIAAPHSRLCEKSLALTDWSNVECDCWKAEILQRNTSGQTSNEADKQ
jgi:hypothetical protein